MVRGYGVVSALLNSKNITIIYSAGFVIIPVFQLDLSFKSCFILTNFDDYYS